MSKSPGTRHPQGPIRTVSVKAGILSKHSACVGHVRYKCFSCSLAFIPNVPLHNSAHLMDEQRAQRNHPPRPARSSSQGRKHQSASNRNCRLAEIEPKLKHATSWRCHLPASSLARTSVNPQSQLCNREFHPPDGSLASRWFTQTGGIKHEDQPLFRLSSGNGYVLAWFPSSLDKTTEQLSGKISPPLKICRPPECQKRSLRSSSGIKNKKGEP